MVKKNNKSKKFRSKPQKPVKKLYRPTLSMKELSEMLTFAKGLAQASGLLALSYYGRANPTLRYDHDLVTEVDLVVEEYIRKEVKQSYPTHKFLGEEMQKLPGKRKKKEPTWVVDPVDGSAAFSAGMPIWAYPSVFLMGNGRYWAFLICR